MTIRELSSGLLEGLCLSFFSKKPPTSQERARELGVVLGTYLTVLTALGLGIHYIAKGFGHAVGGDTREFVAPGFYPYIVEQEGN
jgi:hypothetical protein